jgi:glycerol-3-phosphate acyltransferase PlsY
MNPAVALLVGYLLGSVDFAVLVARSRGVDIYRVGSGNPGAANVARTLGRRYAALVMVGDAAKGVVAAALGEWIGRGEVWAYAAGFAAVVGHCYPLWHRFRGGKGVATAVGVVAWAAPPVAVVAAVVWLILVRATRISSVGSLTATILAIPALALVDPPTGAYWWTASIAALIVYRHRENIARLMKGEERRV